MKKANVYSLLVLTATFLTLVGCQSAKPITPTKVIPLFNGHDLDGWDFFVEDTTVDVDSVWSVRNGVVYCKGNPTGYMRTTKNYENYHLHVEWRWVSTPTNSGVLLHSTGDDKIWPVCIEAQLMAKNAGDLVAMGGAGLTVNDTRYHDPEKAYIIIKKRSESSEKPAGQWNRYDIFCKDNKVRLFVNDTLQNEASETTLTSGSICLQSEGSPIEFRNIYVKPLD